MSTTFTTEREGQMAFFKDFGLLNKIDEILKDNTDGVWKGNIFEFKLNISDLNKVLFQTIKYLSKMRIKGESIPENILLIDLNSTKLYLYHASDYFDNIHKIYIGSASIDVSGFIGKSPIKIYNYSKDEDASDIKNLLKENNFMKIKLDGDCIVGWAERYYRENTTASKGDFLGDGEDGVIKIKGEIREPKKFKDYIIPYDKNNNEEFKFVMDRLNDRLNKKQLGAFYTPIQYAKKAAELVREAIKAVPEGNDYIILDRCAGTGNLESVLTEDELSHCILSTYEYWEWKILNDKFSDKVREIIPPTETNIVYDNGLVSNADATSEEFVNNVIIKKYIDNPKCTIIMFENPPYKDEASGIAKGKADSRDKKNSFIVQEMKKEAKGCSTNDLINQFAWSAFKYYLRQPTDSYIIFGPIKYWKQYSFINKKPLKGFLFNREYFGATKSAISCVLWRNITSIDNKINLEAYDIESDLITKKADIAVNKVYKPASKFYEKVKFKDTDTCGLWCDKNGYESTKTITRTNGNMNDDTIGYLEADSFQISAKTRNITRFSLYNGNGCYLTKTNYLNILPIWVAKHIPLDNWYENDVYCTTSDDGNKYTKDSNFIKSCFIYTCLSNQNKCLSLKASNGITYQNELCFDTNALAKKKLDSYKLTKEEQKLIDLHDKILTSAKKTKNYNSHWNYGVYQITKELNTNYKIGKGDGEKTVYDYPELNGDLNTLRTLLKDYYIKNITPKMFKYELIK